MAVRGGVITSIGDGQLSESTVLLPNPPTRRPRRAPGAPVLAIDPYSVGVADWWEWAPQRGRAPERERQLMRASR
jgi:hypothetical protein